MKNESLALNGCEGGEETFGNSLLELCQHLEGYFLAYGEVYCLSTCC